MPGPSRDLLLCELDALTDREDCDVWWARQSPAQKLRVLAAIKALLKSPRPSTRLAGRFAKLAYREAAIRDARRRVTE